MIKESISQKIKITSLLLIIMVIFLHSYNIQQGTTFLFEADSFFSFVNIFIQNIISEGLTRIAVPLFFIISSFLLFQNFNISSYKDKISKRVHTYLIPYFFWTTTVVLIYFILQSAPGFSQFFNDELIKDLSMRELIIRTWIDPENYPLWFLRDLMILTIFSPLVFLFIKKVPKIFLLILGASWLFGIPKSSIDLSYKPEPVLFFTIGAYFAVISDRLIKIKISNKLFLYLALTYLALLIMKAIFITINPENEILLIKLVHNVSILLGISVIWFFLDRYKFAQLSSLTSFTFLFYVFHEPALRILKKAGYAIMGQNTVSSLILYFSVPILVLLFLTVFGTILKKYFPKFGSIITGNRI
jgi:surface polysaccharide O-acyltransferase-like enzyme